MTIVSQAAGRRAASGASRRPRGQSLKNVIAVVTFVLAVSFAAALVFGLLGH